MNDIMIFNNPEFGEIRTTKINGQPWFVAVDVCRALEIQNHKDAIRRLDDDEKSGVVLTDPHGRAQETNCINEPGLYSLVLGSRKPEAKAFKRWVTHEVIPSIRKHGAYMTPETLKAALLNPDTMIRILTALKEEQGKRWALEKSVESDRPKVLFADSVSTSKNSILVGELAKLLKQNGVNTGQNRLFDTLREKGFLIKRLGTDYNMPTQKAMEMGLFEIKETVINHSDGHTSVNKTLKITGKGQQYFVNLFLDREG